jgi:hypothetical protein
MLKLNFDVIFVLALHGVYSSMAVHAPHPMARWLLHSHLTCDKKGENSTNIATPHQCTTEHAYSAVLTVDIAILIR